jgi:hypothetical protein
MEAANAAALKETDDAQEAAEEHSGGAFAID